MRIDWEAFWKEVKMLLEGSVKRIGGDNFVGQENKKELGR